MAAKSSAPTGIPRATFASMVGERIRSNIIEGVLPPGSQLHEVELAASFGVSRGPVREALQRLIQEGLLRSEPHRGVFVPVMSAADIDDIYLARQALETAAVQRITARSRTASAYKAMDKIVRAMEAAEKADDWKTVANRDLEFHSALVAAAESPRLERMFSTVISETRLCLTVLTSSYEARDDLVEEHRQICELLRNDDTAGAVALLKKHFDDAVVTLKRRLETEDEQVG
ncbi:GntR family transcriptional regulator [Nocardioides gansuensis]|uniref:GntR family transcriptional regulator n=1 Tax=Nocardioides gansuensis TaxID=2138300 RepID=UPI001BA6507D|nr:GntR family transcriptional regulator [Nocardioides gansuensis]